MEHVLVLSRSPQPALLSFRFLSCQNQKIDLAKSPTRFRISPGQSVSSMQKSCPVRTLVTVAVRTPWTLRIDSGSRKAPRSPVSGVRRILGNPPTDSFPMDSVFTTTWFGLRQTEQVPPSSLHFVFVSAKENGVPPQSTRGPGQVETLRTYSVGADEAGRPQISSGLSCGS